MKPPQQVQVQQFAGDPSQHTIQAKSEFAVHIKQSSCKEQPYPVILVVKRANLEIELVLAAREKPPLKLAI